MDEASTFTPLSRAAELVYRAAVERGRVGPEELGGMLDLPAAAVGPAIDVLRSQGLVEMVDDHVVPLPPRTILETAANEARRQAAELSRLWDEATTNLSYVELIQSDEAVSRTGPRLVGEAVKSIRALSIGPVGNSAVRSIGFHVMAGFHEAVARGVGFQVVYGVNVLHVPEGLAVVDECIRAGEEARVFPNVPINLMLVDDRVAMLQLPGAQAALRHALVVRRSGLLDQLSSLFEVFWRMAVPLGDRNELAVEGPVPDQESRRLLAYLSAGLTDDSIAREFRVSERTIGRRVARLQEVLGAHSRFQLGVQASRQGWI